MGDVALSESDMMSMQAQKDYGESGSSSDWTDDEDSDEFDVRSEVEASQHNLAESMKYTAMTVIMKAMRTWESLTCLRFVNRQPQHKAYLIFSVENCGCCSYVGRQSDSRPQTVSIARGCEVEGIALHEIGHALGFWHEQSRPDRDRYRFRKTGLLINVTTKMFAYAVIHIGLLLFFDLSVSLAVKNNEIISPQSAQDVNEEGISVSEFHMPRQTVRQFPIADDRRPDQMTSVNSDLKITNDDLYPVTCGGYLEADEGNITSPFYPDEYPPRMECDWKIAVPAGFSSVLTFSRFELFAEDDCPYNYLAIYDGPSDSSPLLHRLCGAQMPAPIKSSTNTMTVRFVVDGVLARNVFVATFRKASAADVLRCETTDHECEHKCLLLEDDCPYNYLAIYDGPSDSSTLLGRLCGAQMPAPIKSSSNTMSMRFVVDGVLAKNVFVATFRKKVRKVKSKKPRRSKH
nr:unnamed protein product [Spirometra erinaceieuropaei]